MSIHTGCTTHVWLTERRIWPETPRFTILPATNSAAYMESGIDFAAVYVRNSLNNRGFLYYRFWPNGRLLQRSTVECPTLQDVEDFAGAYVGYYSIRGDVIITETFVPAGSPPWACGYSLAESLLRTNEIVRQCSSFNGRSPKDLRQFNLRYVRQPMEGMKRQPDW
jgi:hypothetical protein